VIMSVTENMPCKVLDETACVSVANAICKDTDIFNKDYCYILLMDIL
jgi:hypothetical protein